MDLVNTVWDFTLAHPEKVILWVAIGLYAAFVLLCTTGGSRDGGDGGGSGWFDGDGGCGGD